MKRGERVGHAMFLLVLYCVVLLARGHGVGPVVLMMVIPEFPLHIKIAGWTGLALLVVALLPANLIAYRLTTMAGIVLCFISIILACAESDPALFPLIFAIPFAGYASLWMAKARLPVRGTG
jgi:hypothetical protein